MHTVRGNSLRLNSTLKDLRLYANWIDAEIPSIKLLHLFEKDLSLPGIILLDQNQFAGMVSRQAYFERMSRPYSRDLFNHRPIRVLYQYVNQTILMLSGDTRIQEAVRLSLERSPKLLYEPIVVHLGKDEYQLLDAHQLMLAQAQVHELAMVALEESQEALIKEKELAQITLHSIGDGVITTDAAGYVQSLNSVAERLTGWRVEEARGQFIADVFNIVHEVTREPIRNPAELVLHHGQNRQVRNHTILIAKHNREFVVNDSAAPIRSEDGQLFGAVLVFRDVTQERELSRQLAWQASHDALTQLVNRHQFEQCLQQVFAQSKALKQVHILCCMDLDRFKIVNDTCGHLAGDELLRQISCLIKQTVRQSDVVARLGGDEFAVLLYHCPLQKGIMLAQAIRQRVQEFRFIWEQQIFTIGISIGVSVIDAQSLSVTSVLSEADAACYHAKRQGRNRVHVFQPENDSEIVTSGTPWITQINRALEENRFILYCQPIVPLQSTSPTVPHCYEILLRMLDETDQIVPSTAFISAAERYNLMTAIDRWVIHGLLKSQSQTLQQANTQHSGNFKQHHAGHFLFSINLSGASLNDETLADFVQEQLMLYPFPPHLICFEIAESVAIANLDRTIQVMQSLQALGCQFALDDCGSCMTALRHLKNLPVRYLKIDESLITDSVNDAIVSTIVQSIHQISQLIGVETIAKGVENDTILAAIKEFGINYAQGAALTPPHPLETLKTNQQLLQSLPISSL